MRVGEQGGGRRYRGGGDGNTVVGFPKKVMRLPQLPNEASRNVTIFAFDGLDGQANTLHQWRCSSPAGTHCTVPQLDQFPAQQLLPTMLRRWSAFTENLIFWPGRKRRVHTFSPNRQTRDPQSTPDVALPYLPSVGVNSEISFKKSAGVLEVRGRGRRDRASVPSGGRKGGLGARSPPGVVVVSGLVRERGKIEVDPPLIVVVAVRHVIPALVVGEKARALVQSSVDHLAGNRVHKVKSFRELAQEGDESK